MENLLRVNVDDFVYIGKEANDIDEQELDVRKPQQFINKQEIMDNILNMSHKQAENLGDSRSRFQKIKNRIREDGDLNLNTPAVRRLL